MTHVVTAGSRENPIACITQELDSSTPMQHMLGLLLLLLFLLFVAFVGYWIEQPRGRSGNATVVTATLDGNGVLHYSIGEREREMRLPPSWRDHVSAGGNLKLRVFDDPARLPERIASSSPLRFLQPFQSMFLLIVASVMCVYWRQQRNEHALRRRLKSSGRHVRAECVHVLRTERRLGKGRQTVYLVLGHFCAPDGRWYVAASDTYDKDPGARLDNAIEVLCDAIEPRRSRFAEWTLPPR